ncbi:MAG: TadG family pilus assembly protein [Neorhizobium sp.]|jgi:uncharacterized membrane protein|nr:TadG family pilus assembly protein [Neorhizobium sp.]
MQPFRLSIVRRHLRGTISSARFTRLRRLCGDRSGNIAITTALTLPLMLGVLALGVDYGSLTLQKRQLQEMADLAAISAASQVAAPEQAVLQYFTLNNMNYAVRQDSTLLTPNATLPYDPTNVYRNVSGYADVVRGHYVPDPTVAAGSRFQAGVQPYDSVRVTLHQKGSLYFASSFATPPDLGATGTAATDRVAAFSIGSRLASINEGLLNQLLGQMLGTTISLKAMDYQSLADAQINVLSTLDVLALNLGLQAGTYDSLLKTNINYGVLLTAIGKTTGLTPAVQTIVNNLQKTLNKTAVNVQLQNVLSLGSVAPKLIGQAGNLTVNASVFDIISAAATAANGGKQLALDLGATLPGLGGVKVTLAIGQPAVATPHLAVGSPGSVVRTAQTRLAVEVVVDGLQAVLGLKVRIPLYVEVAYAEARLANITCSTSSNTATVDIDAIPGVAEIAIGDVNTSNFSNFGTEPRVTRAALISTLLLSVSGMADAQSTNMTTKRLTFSPSDIASNKIKTISTENALSSLSSTLLGNLDLRIDLLGLGFSLQPVTAALGATLGAALTPIDSLLYNLLLVLGVRIGEADIQVGGATCRNPVLVQ